MRLRVSALLLLPSLLLAPTVVLAQASGTGTVTGRVVDSSGGVLPGVTVTMKSPAGARPVHRGNRCAGAVPHHQPCPGPVRGARGVAGDFQTVGAAGGRPGWRARWPSISRWRSAR